jgi:hypothetical protein
MPKKKKLPKPVAQKNCAFTKRQITDSSAFDLKQLVWGYKTNDTNFLCHDCDKCKNCVASFYCERSVGLKSCYYCVESEDLTDCFQMINCKSCYKSSGHENKDFVFCDIELSEAEYTDAMSKLLRE